MSDEHSHPLLAQVPLTVSPFVSLPTAPTLPYTYKSLPSAMPPSSTGSAAHNPSHVGGETTKPKYIVSSSGHAVHPDEIIASCRALQAHVQKLQDDAVQKFRAWEKTIEERELAEKRRVAPGWLDSEDKILQPERPATAAPNRKHEAPGSLMDAEDLTSKPHDDVAGEELDRAFGGMNIKSGS